jgi:LmbE family N-acetylglucosaminyl deacetylase
MIQRLKRGLHNKWWLLNYQWRNLLHRLQVYWLLSQGSKTVNISDRSAIIFSPHQDDEVFGCGGIIADKRARGIPVKVVFITDGGGSHFNNSKFTRSEIVEIRRQEALKALEILHVESKDIHFLDKNDGALGKMSQLEHSQTIAEIAELLLAFQPQEVYVTHRQDRSPDHEVSYHLVQDAIASSGIKVDLWEYAIWLLWKSLLFQDLKFRELAGAHRVNIHHVQSQKHQAVKTYRSQYLPIDGDSSPLLPPGFLWRFFLPYEVFFQQPSR